MLALNSFLRRSFGLQKQTCLLSAPGYLHMAVAQVIGGIPNILMGLMCDINLDGSDSQQIASCVRFFCKGDC